jgi:hypothetical protein
MGKNTPSKPAQKGQGQSRKFAMKIVVVNNMCLYDCQDDTRELLHTVHILQSSDLPEDGGWKERIAQEKVIY